MKLILFFILMGAMCVSAQPQPPQRMVLDSKNIQILPIHTEIETLLIFPSPVTLVLGVGMTKGDEPGVVQWQQGKDLKLIILRQLDATKEPLMQIMLEDEVYVYRLQYRDNPASVIQFERKEISPKLGKLSEPQSFKMPSKARRLQLMKLASSVDALFVKIPQEYQGFSYRDVSIKNNHAGLTATVTRIARFRDEDSLIVLGKIRSYSNHAISLKERRASVRVGPTKYYKPADVFTSKMEIPAFGVVDFHLIIVGDGRGGSAHISVENPVIVKFEKMK